MNQPPRTETVALKGSCCKVPSGHVFATERPSIHVVLTPLKADHTCDWTGVKWGSNALTSLSLCRVDCDYVLRGKGASLMNGLKIPPTVTELRVMDNAAPEDFLSYRPKTTTGLESFHATGIDTETTINVCRASPKLGDLALRRMRVELGDWIPGSVKRLRLWECVVQFPGRCFSALGTLYMIRCGLTEVPARLDLLFPQVTCIDLGDNNIISLRGTVFPPMLHTLCISQNSGISVKGVVFPESLRMLALDRCTPITGLAEMELPAGLQTLMLMHNGLATTDGIGFPQGLRLVKFDGNPIRDFTAAVRHAARYGNLHGPFLLSNAAMFSNMHRYYRHQAAIVPLVAVRTFPCTDTRCVIGRLPGDLLRVTLGFLSEVPQL